MARALTLFAVALSMGLLVYWLAGRHVASPADRPRLPGPSAEPMEASRGAPGVANPAPRTADTGPIAPPKTEEEKERESIATRRGPLYSRLHHDLGVSLVAVRPSDDDAATLDLYSAQDTPGNTMAMLNLALSDNVAYYGFRHIRFFVPNPQDAIEKFHLDAEANADNAGNWQTFKK